MQALNVCQAIWVARMAPTHFRFVFAVEMRARPSGVKLSAKVKMLESGRTTLHFSNEQTAKVWPT